MSSPIDTNTSASRTSTESTQAMGASGYNLANAASFSPEGLMLFCQSRLETLDDQIRTGLDKQQIRSKQQALLSELKSFVDGEGDMNDQDGAVFFAEVEKKIAALEAEGVDVKNLRTAFDTKLVHAGGKTGKDANTSVVKSEIEDFGKSIEEVQNDLNRGGELEMIGVQSLMSQRQTAIQLTTNLMSSYWESVKQITGNLGR